MPPERLLRPQRESVVAWLLLLVETGTSYGYELQRALDAHGLRIDPSIMYRTLRRLERDGLLESRWMKPVAGPRRRFYKLTARGRRELDETAQLIKATREVHDDFLRVYAQRRAGRAADAGPSAPAAD